MDREEDVYDYGRCCLPQMNGCKNVSKRRYRPRFKGFSPNFSIRGSSPDSPPHAPLEKRAGYFKERGTSVMLMRSNPIFPASTRLVYSPSRGQCLSERASICQHSSDHRGRERCQETQRRASMQPSVRIITLFKPER